MKKISKICFISCFVFCCLIGSVYADTATFSCEVISSVVIGNVSDAERKGTSDAQLDCRNSKISKKSIRSSNPYAKGTPEYNAYKKAYDRIMSNCRKSR